MPLPRIEPMLAHTKTARDGVEWSIEPKLDGWRALVYVDDTVTVRTRTGRDVSGSSDIRGVELLRLGFRHR
ncbi:MAG: hypothetical protein NVS3B21_27860 [Acidimicrobiales bacterium]